MRTRFKMSGKKSGNFPSESAIFGLDKASCPRESVYEGRVQSARRDGLLIRRSRVRNPPGSSPANGVKVHGLSPFASGNKSGNFVRFLLSPLTLASHGVWA